MKFHLAINLERMDESIAKPEVAQHTLDMVKMADEGGFHIAWAGDYAHDGEFWQFPTSTSVPKPVQKPHPPIWVAARSPITFDWAIENGCNIMSWPIQRPFEEAELYRSQLDEAIAAHPDAPKPIFALMRHTALYDNADDWMLPVRAAQCQLGQFEGLFQNMGDVTNGFPRQIPLSEVSNPMRLSTAMRLPGEPDVDSFG